jgi:hypothetical protein
MRAVSWSALNNPFLLVLTPALWTAIAVGVPFFIALMGKSPRLLVIPLALAVAALPLLAATVYWAFFSQQNWLGLLLVVPTLAPMGLSVATRFSAPSRRGASPAGKM